MLIANHALVIETASLCEPVGNAEPAEDCTGAQFLTLDVGASKHGAIRRVTAIGEHRVGRTAHQRRAG